MRVNLEGKGQAVDGDVTTTGAVCIATGAGYLDEGRMVLREGDHTTFNPERFSQPVIGVLPGTLEPGFYVVSQRMSFPQVLLQLG